MHGYLTLTLYIVLLSILATEAEAVEKLEAMQKEQEVLNPLYQVKPPAHVYSK